MDGTAKITSSGGDVVVTGGGGSGSGSNHYGVYLSSSAEIAAGGAGSTSVTGTAGSGGDTNIGVVVQLNSRISSAGGNVSVIGTGGSGTLGDFGVSVTNSASITAGGSGSVTVVGTGSTGSSDWGVQVNGTAAIITSSGGNVSVTGITNSASEAIWMESNGTISSGGTGTMTIIADSLHIHNSSQTIKAGATGNSTVTIRPYTAGTKIDLGGADVLSGSPKTLGLTDAELDRVFANTLRIGDGSAGLLNVSSSITTIFPAVVNMHLTSGSTMTATSGGIFVGNLALTAGGMIDFNHTGNGVDNVTAYTTSGDIIYVGDPNGFTVNTVDGQSGVSAPSNITLTTAGSSSDLTILAGNSVISTSGNVFVNADRTVTVSATSRPAAQAR